MEKEKIKYYYSSMSKQVMLIIIGILIVLRFILMILISTYDINGYASTINMWGTSLLYLIYGIVCVFFFVAYKCFWTEFDENEIVYKNALLKRSYDAQIDHIKKAHLTKRGILLYGEQQEKLLFVPFFRFGIVSPVGVDKFYKLLKANNVEIQKDFVALPGHGKGWKWLKVIYSCFALFVLGTATQTLALIVAILKTH